MEISAIPLRLTKIRRRCSVTTRPSARGGSCPAAGRSTTSLTRPIVSPSLSSSERPLSRDVKTWRLVMTGHHLLRRSDLPIIVPPGWPATAPGWPLRAAARPDDALFVGVDGDLYPVAHAELALEIPPGGWRR